ncbi:hypothetical protein O181_026867 [Austropuccinia psidii MF-1]|uniref:Uncharacterized protein n=1 Tax=Austropuccinia psidii MF-1 TaxID=1389203 RepID=A0A9Q3H159_9BASI|nr:hypothetical protein [Austropuccinia psidii MF-1]
MESTIIQTSKQLNKVLAHQKEGGKQRRSPVTSTSKPQANQIPQEGKKNNKNDWKKPYFPATGSQESKKMPWKFFQHGRNLDGIQGKRGTKTEKTTFPKEINFSPDV